MLIVHGKKQLQIQLSNGRRMSLENLVKDYERLLNEKTSEKAITLKTITSKLKVDEWFRIDRDVIDENKEEIRRKCNEAGAKGKALWERFEKSNKITDEEPDQYPRLIETYIFKHAWVYEREGEMVVMCSHKGDGMCDEIICDLELQMRICNGENVDDLVNKPDKLPRVRIIQLRNGARGYFGGAAGSNLDYPPAHIGTSNFCIPMKDYQNTPYAFRRVLS